MKVNIMESLTKRKLIREAKVINPGESGWGLLVENDGYFDKSLNEELVKKFLNEGTEIKENEPILINCILQKWGVKNKNGRIYPKDVLMAEVARYTQMVEANSALSEADHPETTTVSLHNISHAIKKMWWGTDENQNILYGTIELAVSPGYLRYGVCSMVGDKIMEYLKRGWRIGISSRGLGSLKTVRGEHIVQKDYEIVGFDLVHSPSTPGAYLFPDIQAPDDLTSKSDHSKQIFRESVLDKPNLINEKTKKIITKLNKFL